MFIRIYKAIINRLSPWILGRHPYNTIFSFNYHNVRHIIAFLLNQKKQLPVSDLVFVDVGAGFCPYHSIFANNASKYIAVDTVDTMPKNDSREIEFREGLAENIPIADSTVDCVLLNQVLEHVNDPDLAMSEIFRILKPGGLFIGSVPHISPVHLEPLDYRRYTDLGLQQLLSRYKFREVSIVGNGGVYSSVALLLAMDWMLSPRYEDRIPSFSENRAFWLAPMVGVLNLSALMADKVFIDTQRSPANLCWVARKISNI